MWYKIDITKLVLQLLPPILRSRFLSALANVMTVPLRHLYSQFCSLKKDAEAQLNITGNVQYLEKALNDVFFLHDQQIYIITPEEKEEENVRAFHFISERQLPNHIFMEQEGQGFSLQTHAENSGFANFIVMVPTFLCTSTMAREDDRYQWEHLWKIKNILKTYKPAGRTFGIELYDYE